MTAPALIEFLLARIAEDEHRARQAWAGGYRGSRWLSDPDRQLAECEAKREVITECRIAIEREDAEGRGGTSVLWGVCVNILRRMTLPYADRPDCREEWRA